MTDSGFLFPIHGKRMDFDKTKSPKILYPPKPICHTLSKSDMAWGERVGRLRHSESIRLKLKDKYGGEGVDIQIDGARGELAVARLLNIKWTGHVNTFKVPDVGIYHVRTRSKRWHDLIVRDDDADDEPFVMVTSESRPKYCIRGWQNSTECKQPQYIADHGNRNAPAYFYPQDKLNDIRILVKKHE